MEQTIQQFKREIEQADAILIGAGAGLSISAGFTYTGKRFEENFADFEKKYSFHDMYSPGFYHFAAPEEKWAYWSRHIYINRYQDPSKPVYPDLLKQVQGKDYFVLTTNVDHCFQKAGFIKPSISKPIIDSPSWKIVSFERDNPFNLLSLISSLIIASVFFENPAFTAR
jgi:NAD-dependent SIR2 family protein deacetylase